MNLPLITSPWNDCVLCLSPSTIFIFTVMLSPGLNSSKSKTFSSCASGFDSSVASASGFDSSVASSVASASGFDSSVASASGFDSSVASASGFDFQALILQ